MNKTLTHVDANELGLPQIIANNGAGIAPLLRSARRMETRAYHKRPACATSSCISCPYMRDGGSC